MNRAVVRLPPEVIARLDALAVRLRGANPGRSCSRAALVRALVREDLAVIEQGEEHFAALAMRMRSAKPRS
jgi:hypothetical protein